MFLEGAEHYFYSGFNPLINISINLYLSSSLLTTDYCD